MSGQSQIEHKHHYLRTPFAAFFGLIAVWLILASFLVAWLNQTITDTSQYVSTVAPLAQKPQVQDFVIVKIDKQIDSLAPGPEVAALLLTEAELSGKTPEQIQLATKLAINDTVREVLSSPEFTALWRDSNKLAHEQLINQISANESVISLDLTTLVSGMKELLADTRVGPVLAQVELPETDVNLEFKGKDTAPIISAYDILQRATVFIILGAITAITLASIISVHHAKTLRRIALATGLGLLALWGVLRYAQYIPIAGTDPLSRELSQTIIATLTRSLVSLTLFSGVALVIIVAGSKVYQYVKNRSADPKDS